jgi:hypothetical protein
MPPQEKTYNFQMVSNASPNGNIQSLEDAEKISIDQQLVNTLITQLLVCRIKNLAHKFTARFWKRIDLVINLPSTIFAAISGTSSLSGSSHFVAGTLGLSVAVLTAANTFLQPSINSSDHFKVAAKYAALRNRIDLFLSQNSIEVISKNGDQRRIVNKPDHDFIEKAQQFLEKEIIGQINDLEEKSPMSFDWASKKARQIVLPEKKLINQSPNRRGRTH